MVMLDVLQNLHRFLRLIDTAWYVCSLDVTTHRTLWKLDISSLPIDTHYCVHMLCNSIRYVLQVFGISITYLLPMLLRLNILDSIYPYIFTELISFFTVDLFYLDSLQNPLHSILLIGTHSSVYR